MTFSANLQVCAYIFVRKSLLENIICSYAYRFGCKENVSSVSVLWFCVCVILCAYFHKYIRKHVHTLKIRELQMKFYDHDGKAVL